MTLSCFRPSLCACTTAQLLPPCKYFSLSSRLLVCIPSFLPAWLQGRTFLCYPFSQAATVFQVSSDPLHPPGKGELHLQETYWFFFLAPVLVEKAFSPFPFSKLQQAFTYACEPQSLLLCITPADSCSGLMLLPPSARQQSVCEKVHPLAGAAPRPLCFHRLTPATAT